MAMIGYEFQPGSDEDMRRRLNGQNPGLGPMSNEALKILSLHLPSVLSGHPLSPAELMRPHVGGTAPTPAVAASQGVVGAPGGSGGGTSELAQLMSLINAALHATPAPPSVTPGDQTKPQPVASSPVTNPISGPVETQPYSPPTAPAPTQSPYAPRNPFGDGRDRGGSPFV